MQIFSWVRTTDDPYEIRHVSAIGETVNDARKAILERAEKLFQYDAVTPHERECILAGESEVFDEIAKRRERWNTQLQADIGQEPDSQFDDGQVFWN
jgi:hypothetical protein